MKKKTLIVMLVLSLILTGCEKYPKTITEKVNFIAVGDNLIHDAVYADARQSDGTYNFDFIFENTKSDIEEADLAVINQETILVKNNNNVSSYPRFGTPGSMTKSISDAGFDIVLHATNHTWDKGSEGVENSLELWKDYPDIKVLGIHKNENDFNEIDIVEKNGIKFAMFNYTYGLNGFTVPSSKHYMVNLLDDEEKFISDVKEIEDDVDMTICFLHIGTEYVYNPTTYQKEYVENLIDAGADIIVCAHPHVLEPYKEVTTDKGNKALVYYSLGNFCSSQNVVPRLLGGMAKFTVVKETTIDRKQNVLDEKVYIESFDLIPTVTHITSSEHTVYKLSDYTEDLAKENKVGNYDPKFSKAHLEELFKQIMDGNVTYRYVDPTPPESEDEEETGSEETSEEQIEDAPEILEDGALPDWLNNETSENVIY